MLKVSGANEMGEPNGEPTSTGIRPRQATSSHSDRWQLPHRATSSHAQRRYVLALQARGRRFEPCCAHCFRRPSACCDLRMVVKGANGEPIDCDLVSGRRQGNSLAEHRDSISPGDMIPGGCAGQSTASPLSRRPAGQELARRRMPVSRSRALPGAGARHVLAAGGHERMLLPAAQSKQVRAPECIWGAADSAWLAAALVVGAVVRRSTGYARGRGCSELTLVSRAGRGRERAQTARRSQMLMTYSDNSIAIG